MNFLNFFRKRNERGGAFTLETERQTAWRLEFENKKTRILRKSINIYVK